MRGSPIDRQQSCTDGVVFLRLVSGRFDRRAKKHGKDEPIVLRYKLKPTSFFLLLMGCKSVL